MESLAERSGQDLLKKEQMKREKMKKIVPIVVLIVLIVGTVSFSLFQTNRTYTNYTITGFIERADSNSVRYMEYNGKILKYSKDGASAMKLNGEILWNGSYEFKNPYAAVCGEYVAIADIGGKEIVVYNGKDAGTRLSVKFPIEQIDIAKQGVVAVILEDDDRAKINIYDPYSITEQLKVSIKTSTDSDGYPVAIGLSEDGSKLVTSFINISKGILQSSLNFYNFGAVGQNSVDRIVGSRPMNKDIIVDVDFINEDTICAFSERGFYLYEMKETPQDLKEVKLEEKIKSVCYSKNHIAVVKENMGNQIEQYSVIVYDKQGEVVLEQEIDYRYEKIQLAEQEIIFYDETACNIMRFNGSEKFCCGFENPIIYFSNITSSDKYIMVNQENINEIRLSGGRREDKK